ncbi:hypothetical protein SDC9_175537 [bioreactor metagenome]|uniref:Uncharacterized protein n=1 Tax=bioreactor metagenome TaxID=1076179 RepID=A0A645GMF3_9ZZZZ
MIWREHPSETSKSLIISVYSLSVFRNLKLKLVEIKAPITQITPNVIKIEKTVIITLLLYFILALCLLY